MMRNVVTLTILTVSTPLYAHEGMVLEGAVHKFLHVIGNDTLVAVGAIVIAGVAAIVARRIIRGRRPSARSTTAR
jgi:hypothetical protein